MPAVLERAAPLGVEECLDAYEVAQQQHGHADLAGFLPDPRHPAYLEALVELIRLDLEYGWARGRARSLDDYLCRFPELLDSNAALTAVAFEEYRLRRQLGAAAAPEEYAARYGLNTTDWPRAAGAETAPPDSPAAPASSGAADSRTLVVAAQACVQVQNQNVEDLAAWCRTAQRPSPSAQFFQEVHESDPCAALRLAQAVTSLPQSGVEFAGFRLLRELGRGAFGRVFLAEDAFLSNRQVVLKVSVDAIGESRLLAQLQHAHIVPVYSVQRAGALHAACMPYLGETTLADIIREVSHGRHLPLSGRELVSTLLGRKSTLRDLARPRPAGLEPNAAAPALTTPAAAAQEPPLPIALERLNSATYVEAILALAAQLASGLAHAHERGILHRDLKPANILLADDGQPMLLDFNLAADTKLHNSPAAALVGGTLPYMAPEQLLAYHARTQSADARSDIYSLGVILYELLTGQLPFWLPSGQPTQRLAQMLSERTQRPPPVRLRNPAVSRAADAIVGRCLEPDAAKRYQTATQLQEDLERHLQHLPLRHTPEPSAVERLRKWVRRHPRASSSTTLAAVATVLLVLGGSAYLGVYEHLARLQARAAFADFRFQARSARYYLTNLKEREHRDRGCSEGLTALGAYGVLDDASWQERPAVRRLDEVERERLRHEAGELLLLVASAIAPVPGENGPRYEPDLETALAYNGRAAECFESAGVPRALWLQRALLLQRLGRSADADLAQQSALGLTPHTAQDYYLEGREQFDAGRYRNAHQLLVQATDRDPQHFWAWFLRARCLEESGNQQGAVAAYDTCVALEPSLPWLFYNRGLARLRQRQAEAARADFDRSIQLSPDQPECYFNRALAFQALGRKPEALCDLDRAIEAGCPATRVYFLRSRLRTELGDRAGAERDHQEGLRQEPRDHLSWNARGFARLKEDPRGALADFRQAVAHNARSLPGLENQAHVLAEKLAESEEAIKVLDQAILLYPDHWPTRVSRGVLHARLLRRELAHRDAEEALLLSAAPATLYQAANIYALTSKQHPEDSLKALQLLSSALRGNFGFEYVDTDADLDAIRARPEFKRIVESARTLRGATAGP